MARHPGWGVLAGQARQGVLAPFRDHPRVPRRGLIRLHSGRIVYISGRSVCGHPALTVSIERPGRRNRNRCWVTRRLPRQSGVIFPEARLNLALRRARSEYWCPPPRVPGVQPQTSDVCRLRQCRRGPGNRAVTTCSCRIRNGSTASCHPHPSGADDRRQASRSVHSRRVRLIGPTS